MKKSRYEYPVPEHQADTTLDQANPVSGTKYEVLPETKNVRIISIFIQCTWTVQPTPLEVHVTIDGQSIAHSQTDPVSDERYHAEVRAYNPPTAQALSLTNPASRAFLYEGRSVKIEAEITGGTVSNLAARVKYAKW